MKRDFRGRFSVKKNQINSFITGIVWDRMKFVGMIVAIVITSGMYFGYANSTPKKVEAATVATSTPQVIVPPILQKIAKCESRTGQYGKSGQVAINPTMDIGKYQINIPANGTLATKMGYDLSKPEDNEKFAVWLFDNEGDAPWNSSKACWDK